MTEIQQASHHAQAKAAAVPGQIRTEIFQFLKPVCVRLSEVALSLQGGTSAARELLQALEELRKVLRAVVDNGISSYLDAKIAEYVFFPLSHVFRIHQKLPDRALEVALQCVKVLLQTGWRDTLHADLGLQLLILLTFLADDVSGSKNKAPPSEEIQTTAFACLAAVFVALTKSKNGKANLLDAGNIPALGHAITVMLDGLKDGASGQVQNSAIDALLAFSMCVTDRDVYASFLPGIVSCLSHVLTPSTKARRLYKVIEGSLRLLAATLKLVLADSFTANLPTQHQRDPKTAVNLAHELDMSWLKATSAQVKLVLANVVRLRYHDRSEVRSALYNLCAVVLEDCKISLCDAAPMMIETVITMSCVDDDNVIKTKLTQLIHSDTTFAELLRASLYNWLVALPRVMLSNDIGAKEHIVNQVSLSFRLLNQSDLDLSVIENILLDSLRDGLINAIRDPMKMNLLAGDVISPSSDHSLITLDIASLQSEGFAPVLAGRGGGKDSLPQLEQLIIDLSASTNSLIIARDSLDQARCGQGDVKLVSLWLSLNILQSKAKQASPFDEFIETTDRFDLAIELREELFAIALSILTQNDDEALLDWRLQAVALEAMAFHGDQLKTDFRLELIDVLYPVLQLMGSRNERTRNHAMVCLNKIATACGYAHTQELLVANGDYIVNAVAVKISTFDIQPQAPQVLLMMIKLCGPTLLTYLDDLVDGIFDALDCFHGYPNLVELLFSALRGIVEEGAKSPQLPITAGEHPTHLKPAVTFMTFNDVAASLRSQAARSTTETTTAYTHLPEDTPHRPWKELREPNIATSSSPDDDTVSENVPSNNTKPTLPKSYTMIQRIASLTQHHLPSSSPSVRVSLLSLLNTALPYLANHEDTFLPLVHTLWPVLTPRLADKEAYVVSGALEVMSVMCEGAGDFMSGRIQSIWPIIQRIHAGIETVMQPVQQDLGRRPAAAKSSTSMSPVQLLLPPSFPSKGLVPSSAYGHSATSTAITPTTTGKTTHYIPTPTLTLNAALTRFLLRLTTHVRISPLLFSEIVSRMLRRALVVDRRADVREALERRDPDAVWLELERWRWQRKVVEGGSDAETELREEWAKARPRDVEGGVRFVEVVF